MPNTNWNDLRYLLAVQRGGSLVAAARQLRVDDTTVARRLKALAAAFGGGLVQREPDGRLVLTALGQTVARRAEQIEREFALIVDETGSARNACGGTVRVTSVPIVINRLLAPSAAALLARHAAMVLELVPDSRDFSLTRREADLALRLARPKSGGTQVRTRKLATLGYAVYAPAEADAREARSLPWIGYDESMVHLPQARWMANGRRGEHLAGIRVHDAETAIEAVAARLGRSLLPEIVAAHDPRLRRAGGTVLTRELWLAVHADLAGLPRIAAVTGWIEDIIAQRTRSDAPAPVL